MRLGGVRHIADHPLLRMLKEGLVVTVNSDDPAYFGGYIVDNYVAVCDALGLRKEHVVALARNSINASFADPSAKARWLAEIDL